MWGRLVLATLLAFSAPQSTVPVTFAWDDRPDQATATWEVERNGTSVPCGSVTLVGGQRRCTAALPLGAATFRVRGTVISEGTPLVGPWSVAITEQISGPGFFTIRAHREGSRVAVALDAASNPGATFTGDTNWTHTPTGTPRGVIVYVVHATQSATDEVVGVTYGGVAMTEVSVSPQTKATGEAMGLHVFFLGSSIPTGPQTIAVDTSAATVNKAAGAQSLTAADDTEIIDDVTWNSDALANPTGTLSLGGRSALALEMLASGQGAVGGVTPLANWTATESDVGNHVVCLYTYNIVSTTDVTVGWTQTSEDAVGIALAIAEVVGGGGISIPVVQHFRQRIF